jgi:hypothetical protein
MTDCPFCDVPPIKADNTPVWLITNSNNQSLTNEIYKSLTQKSTETMTAEEFKHSTLFTPKARLTLTLEQANELLTHSQIWKEIISKQKTQSNHNIIFTDMASVIDSSLSKKIENQNLPRDWDIIVLPGQNTQYVLTKRAANILLASSRQFHNPLNDFITSIPGLRIVQG